MPNASQMPYLPFTELSAQKAHFKHPLNRPLCLKDVCLWLIPKIPGPISSPTLLFRRSKCVCVEDSFPLKASLLVILTIAPSTLM